MRRQVKRELLPSSHVPDGQSWNFRFLIRYIEHLARRMLNYVHKGLSAASVLLSKKRAADIPPISVQIQIKVILNKRVLIRFWNIDILESAISFTLSHFLWWSLRLQLDAWIRSLLYGISSIFLPVPSDHEVIAYVSLYLKFIDQMSSSRFDWHSGPRPLKFEFLHLVMGLFFAPTVSRTEWLAWDRSVHWNSWLRVPSMAM